MLALSFKDTSICELSKLQPGEIFFHRLKNTLSMAVRVFGEEKNRWWLNLVGGNAFQLGEDSEGRKQVLRVNIDPARFRVRVDQSSMSPGNEEHRVGKLIVNDNGQMGITAAWPGAGRQDVILLNDWRHSTVSSPYFIFESWALVYLDEAGQWVDIASAPKNVMLVPKK
jgi:hypothetical protein